MAPGLNLLTHSLEQYVPTSTTILYIPLCKFSYFVHVNVVMITCGTDKR